jgi:hypothetical protein
MTLPLADANVPKPEVAASFDGRSPSYLIVIERFITSNPDFAQ